MDLSISLDESSLNAYKQLFHALSLIPISHYLLAFLLIWTLFLYNFLEIHFFQDLFSGFRGAPVALIFHPSSHIYHDVVSKCRILHGRYLATPWLSSPHFQTAFLNFFGNPPVFSYSRQLFHASDGGTIALDWLTSSDGVLTTKKCEKGASGRQISYQSIYEDYLKKNMFKSHALGYKSSYFWLPFTI